jgi:nicotinate-nucleotide pyrophosphorylase (carboxylating)
MAVTVTRTDIDAIVRRALAEDVGPGDVTSEALFSPEDTARAEILVKEPGVVSGINVAERVFRSLDPAIRFESLSSDGDKIDEAPMSIASIEGSARALLTGERVALNLLGRLSGIATLTRQYVDEVEGTSVVILDTRKTTPGLRSLEKDAVRDGGAQNHRHGLFDGILVKDNHLRLAGGVLAAVRRLHEARAGLPIEVEAETLAEVREALDAGAERILLDNMPAEMMREAVGLAAGRAWLEASGGVSLATVRELALTGVDAISVGALTHSARSLDVSMEVAQ